MDGCVSSINSWFHEPIVLSKESCRLSIFTAVALLAIGLATYCFFRGTMPGYNEIFAYSVWGITGAAVLSTITAYAVKAILYRNHILQVKKELIQQKTEIKEQSQKRYNAIFEKLFPGSCLEDLEVYGVNLSGATGYLDQQDLLPIQFPNGNGFLRGRQRDGRPFLAVRLVIVDNEDRQTATLLIGPNSRGQWWIDSSIELYDHIYNPIHNDRPESAVVLDWLVGILSGESRFLLNIHAAQNESQSCYVEARGGPTVSLWNDSELEKSA